jgi:hypothetical protein
MCRGQQRTGSLINMQVSRAASNSKIQEAQANNNISMTKSIGKQEQEKAMR